MNVCLSCTLLLLLHRCTVNIPDESGFSVGAVRGGLVG